MKRKEFEEAISTVLLKGMVDEQRKLWTW